MTAKERKLTKKETVRVAAKLLVNIYGENVDAVATIINAEAKVLEGDNSGAKTLVDALNTVMVFMEELIIELRPKSNENGKRNKEKHYPRGC